MKSIWTFRVALVLGLLAISLAVRGQSITEIYGKKSLTAEQREKAAAFQAAAHLVDGTNWDAGQRLFLEQIIINPASAKELASEPLTLFTAEQIKDIFYNPASIDLTKYREVAQLASLADEKRFMVAQTIAVRAGLWRQHMADIAATHKVNFAHLEFFYDVGQWLNDPRNTKAGNALLRRSTSVFDLVLGRAAFGNVGGRDASCKKGSGTTADLAADCPCNQGSYFNWSCNDSCGSAGGCHETNDGCGFLEFYPCNGHCQTGDVIIQ